MNPRILIIPAVLVLFISSSVYAERMGREDAMARQVLKRTAVVIFQAQKAVARHKVYTGDLSKAIQNQKYAKTLYGSGEFRRSIHHSLYARRLASLAIRANRGYVRPSDMENESERKFRSEKGAPSEAELDVSAQKEMAVSGKDEDFAKAKLDLDVNIGGK